VAFTQRLVDVLAPRVALAFPDDKVTPTGVPPHVSIQRQMQAVKNVVEELPGRVRAAIAEELEQRQLDAGSITRTSIQGMLDQMLANLQSSFAQANPGQARQVEAPAAALQFQTWLVDGELRRVPADFKLTQSCPPAHCSNCTASAIRAPTSVRTATYNPTTLCTLPRKRGCQICSLCSCQWKRL